MLVRIASFFKRLIGKQQTESVRIPVHVPNCDYFEAEAVDIEETIIITNEQAIEVLEPINKSKQRQHAKETKIKEKVKKLKADEPVGIDMGMEVKNELAVNEKIRTKNKNAKVFDLRNHRNAARDITYMMEIPFLALSKRRKKPLIYEKTDSENTIKVKVTRHSEHFLASIYDWDIVLFVAGKIQKIINDGSDIPPRKIVFGRQEILRALHKHDGKKEEKDLVAALYRLQSTMIETNIRNEDGKYGSVFSFIDSWSFTERKDVKELKVTLSDWLYEGICEEKNLLMVDDKYFEITSGLKKWLYRIARKHAGIQGGFWEFLVETLHERSGSEMDLKYFKRDLKTAVSDNDLPGYSLEWKEKNKKSYVVFKSIKDKKNSKLKAIS